MSKINLEEFAGGALQEKFEQAFEKTIQNMLDPNTPWKNKRKITVEVTFEQDEMRQDTAVHVSVVTKLAPVKPVETRMVIGKNLKTGETFAEEYGKQIRGQMSIDDFQENEVGEQLVDVETGEVKEPEKIVDFRAKQA